MTEIDAPVLDVADVCKSFGIRLDTHGGRFAEGYGPIAP